MGNNKWRKSFTNGRNLGDFEKGKKPGIVLIENAMIKKLLRFSSQENFIEQKNNLPHQFM